MTSFDRKATRTDRVNIQIASRSSLWWNPEDVKHGNLSWVELGQEFYEGITASTVPLDTRAIRALKKSPLVLDLYSWLTYKAHEAASKDQDITVSWTGLQAQLGTDYSDLKNFKQKVRASSAKINSVYPGLRISDGPDGLTVLHTSQPAIERPSSKTIEGETAGGFHAEGEPEAPRRATEV